MSILSLIAGAIGPVTKLIDELHTSDEERGKLQNALAKLNIDVGSQFIGYESQLNQQRADIVKAEAQGDSWLQRSWRPITMLTFLVLVVADAFGLLPFRLAGEAWTLLQLGLGGYVVGRSAEKIAPMIVRARRGAD